MSDQPKSTAPAAFAPAGLLGGDSVFIHFDGWGRFTPPDWRFGRMECARIIGETPKRYRVEFLEDWPRGDKGDIVLVPKWAVTEYVPPNAPGHRAPTP